MSIITVGMHNANTVFGYLLFACKTLWYMIPCIVLLSLGTWQIFRLKEKLLIIQLMDSDPVTLPVVGVEEYSYRKVRLRGVFYSKYVRVFAGKDGYYLVQPAKIAADKYILVTRGTFTEENITIGPTALEREIEGVVHCKSRSISKWVVKNNPKQNLWFWYDTDEMSHYLKVPLETCIIWGNDTVTANGARPNPRLTVRNDHLEYAITWYVLAFTWACGCFIYARGHSRKQKR